MSDPNPAAPDTSTQNPAQSAAAPQQPAAASPPPAVEQPIMSTAALNERLERERKTFLRELGVENVDDAKAALAALKAKQDAEKTEAQKNAEKLAELDRVKSRASQLEETVKARASREMAGLSEEQKAAVVAIAGEDTAAQLRAIDVLAPTWAKAAAPAAQQPAAPAQPATPATTAPPRSAPSDSTQTTASPKETYQRLKGINPVAAAAYLAEHAREIYPSA